MTNIGKLKVGRASAGSGKTFTLTIEYVSLLIDNPDNYKHILAVTFTNKATNEMKTRIVDTLHGIATNNPDADKYLNVLKDRFKGSKTEEEIRQTCQSALSHILHDYSHFRIETIDSFFQSIIRDLARELNLTANLRIDLNQEEALADAVHKMIEWMNKDDSVYKAVLAYVQDNLNREDKNWKIESEVADFSRNIFNEQYLQHEKAINEKTSEKGFYAKYKHDLQQELERIHTERLQNAESFLQYCENYALDSSSFIKGKSGVYTFFPKIADGQNPKIPAALEADPDADWMKDENLNSIHKPVFQHMFKHELELRREDNTINAIMRHLNQMSLLGMVDATLRKINNETNRFILADTAYKLNEIINGNDIPFIYEKAASSFKFIMIDEFQDTSELQWKNFIPLIKECIDRGCMCLIVGDVKQSIYRWRNSDWSILNNIGKNVVFKDVIDEESLQKALDTNRRSDEHIVDFNNKFFAKACKDVASYFHNQFPDSTEAEEIETAYNEVEQKLDGRHAGCGYVEVVDLKQDDKKEAEETEAEETKNADKDAMLDEVERIVHNLIYNQHVQANDITILTRTNDNLKSISKHLKDVMPEVSVVSNEAYQLDSSDALSIMILAMKVIANYTEGEYESGKMPFHLFLYMLLAMKYQTLVCGTPVTETNAEQVLQATEAEWTNLLPEGFVSRMEELQVLPLYELCVELHRLFRLDTLKGQAPYLFCFMDEVAAFVEDKGADLHGLIDYWEETLHKKTIPASSINGIQLMSIHKSKGLEFHTVIIPYCNWEMVGKTSVIWCEYDDSKHLPVIPVKFKKDLHETAFYQKYEQEQMKNYVDNLNLLYVAFTRAVHNLFIITDKKVSKKKDKKNGEETSSYTTYEVIKSATEGLTLPIGSIVPHCDSKEQGNSIEIDYKDSEMKVAFRQSNRSKEFVADHEEGEMSYISKGLVVHKIFESVHDVNDIPKVMNQLRQEGVLKDKAFADEMERIVDQLMSNPQARNWFDPSWKVMNECSIITLKDGIALTKRPDRVIYNDNETIIIDYKTGQKSEEHQWQVRKYIRLLREMGMHNVHGYIWYLKDNEIEEVKS